MAEFTKEQRDILIKTAEYMVKRENTSEYSENIRKVAEIALAALTAEPFMYGIVDPEGEAYFDECCVSGGKSELSEIVSNLNDQCESPGEEYMEVPLYRLPLLEGLK